MSLPEKDRRLCFPCARRKLAGKEAKDCADCAAINADPMEQLRRNLAKPSPLAPMTSSLLRQLSLTCPAPSGWAHKMRDDAEALP